jgi:hypothetical protein
VAYLRDASERRQRSAASEELASAAGPLDAALVQEPAATAAGDRVPNILVSGKSLESSQNAPATGPPPTRDPCEAAPGETAR